VPDIFNASTDKKIPTETSMPKSPPVEIDKIKTEISNKSRAFASFLTFPFKVKFETQEDDEKIILLLRRHPLTNVPWLLLVVIMAIAPVIVGQVLTINLIPFRFQFITVIMWYLLTFAIAFQNFLSWDFNVDLVTDQRVVHIGFPNILYREINQARLEQIQETSVKVGGFIRSLFDYGDVLVQTASEIPDILFDAIPHPAEVGELLNEIVGKEEELDEHGHS
jgi:hypothetical protein